MDLNVKYKRGDKLVGSTSRALVKNNTACVTDFDEKEEAAAFYNKFDNETVSNFGNTIWLNKTRVLVDDGYEVFDAQKKLKFHIWGYSRTQTKIISMSESFVKLFQGIIIGLRSLNARDRYHGRLKEGVTYSNNLDVRLYNMSKQNYSLDKGILKDLDDLRELVETVIKKNPYGQGFEKPDCVELFIKFKDMFKAIKLHHSINVEDWKFYAYFSYINPIFADANDRIVMIKKFNNLWSLFAKEVNMTLTFSDPPATMPEWWFRLRPGSYLHDRCADIYLYACDGFTGEAPKSIIAFYKACFRHKDEKCRIRAKNIDEVAIEIDLLEALPDYLPKVFYEFVRLMSWKEFPNLNLFNSYITFFQESDPKDPKFAAQIF